MYCMASCSSGLAGMITVNALKDLSNTGQNDIDGIRNYCNGASRPESSGGVGTDTANYLSKLSFNQIRGINVDDTNANDLSGQNRIDANGKFVPSLALESVLQNSMKYKYKPFIVVGQQVPYYLLQRYGKAWTWSESTWNLYRDYAYKFIRYVVLDYQGSGFKNTLFDIGNEIDIASADIVWTQKFIGNNGSPERYAHLKKIYEVWQKAVNKVAKAAPNREISIAGPAIVPYSIYISPQYYGFNWRDTFIDDVANHGWRLNIFSFHYYGDQGAVGNGSAHPDFPSLKKQIESVQTKLKSRKLRAKVNITEWGQSSITNNRDLGKINYTPEGAAWVVAFFKDAVDQKLNDATYLIMRDNFGTETTGIPTVPALLHMKSNKQYPKPIYNACRMFSLLPGSRKTVNLAQSQPNLVSIASGDQNSVGIIVANYNYLFDYPNHNFRDKSSPEEVKLQFNNLPFSGSAVLQQYLIDANTSNLAKYVDANLPSNLSGTELQKVMQTNIAISNGSVTLPSVTLGKSAVSLWLIKRP